MADLPKRIERYGEGLTFTLVSGGLTAQCLRKYTAQDLTVPYETRVV